jgi:DNA-directed RNA polymerase subunit M/transcription elongation factor TFIIS
MVEVMKPLVNRIANVPLTALVSCHRCYYLISYDPTETFVKCPACGTTVRAPLSSLDSFVTPG